MNYEINYMPRAIKQLARIPKADRIAVVDAIAQLSDRDCWLNVKRLTKHQYQYRLRIGNYRVLFDIEEKIVTIYICEVKKRDGQTYK